MVRPPLPVHPDPMMDFYKDVCSGDIGLEHSCYGRDVDPMFEEAWAACVAAMLKPLSFSPAGSPGVATTSPVYVPGGMDWGKLVALNDEAAALGCSSVIHFRPGVQQEIDGHITMTGITEQVTDMLLEERKNSIVDNLFVPCEQPILQTPTAQNKSSKNTGRAKARKSAIGELR